MVDEINAAGGVLDGKQLELVTFTRELDVAQSLEALQQAIEQGIPFVALGSGLHIALALSEAVARAQPDAPGQPRPLLNHGAIDPALDQRQMQLLALPLRCRRGHENGGNHDLPRRPPGSDQEVFLIDQDYSFGHSFAAAARRQLHDKAPDIEIVGDEFHPLQKIKDFAPYVDKIKASGADSAVTGDWGNDLSCSPARELTAVWM